MNKDFLGQANILKNIAMVNLWPFTYNIGGLKAFNGAFIW